MMFFLVCGGVSPLRHLKPLLSWKNHVTAKIVCVAADILRVVANISRVVADKAVEEAKNCWPMNFFSIFWGISMVKIHFFLKVFKKWSSFKGGGVQDPKVEILTLFFF